MFIKIYHYGIENRFHIIYRARAKSSWYSVVNKSGSRGGKKFPRSHVQRGQIIAPAKNRSGR